jgi:hypothetical protein
MAEAERILGKKIRAECKRMAEGLTHEEWKQAVIQVNTGQVKMKVGMGPVGAAAMQIRVLAGDHVSEKRSASMISERLEQTLLDSKRVKDEKVANYDHNTVLGLLNRRGPYAQMEAGPANTQLAAMLGLKPSQTRPMINRIWREGGRGLRDIVTVQFPLFTATTRNANRPEIAKGLAKQLFHEGMVEPTSIGRFVLGQLQQEQRDRARVTTEEETCSVEERSPSSVPTGTE